MAATHAELDQFDEQRDFPGVMLPEPDVAKAEAHFERALRIGEQKAKSWELRAAMIIARLQRDLGKRQQARDSLWLVHRGLRHT